MSGELAQIILRDNGDIQIKQTDEHGISTTKLVAANDFINSFSAVAQADTGLLPAGIKQYVKQGQNVYLAVDLPAHIRKVTYVNSNGTTEYAVPMPNHVWFIAATEVPGGLRIRNTRIFITRNPIIDPEETLYSYPFGNVYRPECNICWGNINIPTMPSLASMGSINELFYSGPFNGDLSGLHLHIPFEGRDLSRGEHLFTALNDKPLEDFPFWEYMERTGTYRSRFSTFCSERG